jgi:two-component system, NtrC family, sensor kinase
MGGIISRIRLRTYLLTVLIPLTVLPLLLLAGLLLFFIQKSFDDEVNRRARPEISTLARNIDTLEKRLLRSVSVLSRSDELKLAALTRNEARLQARVRPWLDTSLFDEVRIFSHRGVMLGSYQRRDRERISSAWGQLFNLPEKPQDRIPAGNKGPAQGSGGSFANSASRLEGSSLNKDFQNYILREGAWVLRSFEKSSGGGDFVLRVYRSVLDSDHKSAGFIEGLVVMDSAKWAHLSRYQGVEFVVIDEQREIRAASQDEISLLLKDLLVNWKTLETASDSFFPSRMIELEDLPVEFFFAPLSESEGQTDSWIGVGLSRSQHVFLQNRILAWVVGITLLLSLAVALFAFLTSEKLTAPIRHLVRAAEEVRAGKSVEPLNVESTEEIGYLVERFNEMTLSVQAAKRTLEAKLEELAESNIQLTQMQDQLIQSAKMSSLGQLVAGVAHELNNPIAFIYSNMVQMRQYLKNIEDLTEYFEGLKKNLDQKQAAQLEKVLEDIEWNYVREDMSDIVQSCLEGSVRVKDIVLGLRNFSRLDKGEFGEVDVNEALKNTAKLLSGQFKNRVEIDWGLCDDSYVRCNLSQVNQVFMNIMANAIQAIDGEGTLIVATENVEYRQDEYLRIRIRDTGQGMPPEVLNKIFDPFFTTKGVGEGTGLGLSIVYGIVQKHGGFIDVKSVQFPDPMHGSTFDIYFPKKGPSVDTSLDEAS